jgi:hypothetical protein
VGERFKREAFSQSKAEAKNRGKKELKMAATYRRKKGSDTWHFCSNCRHWPTSDYDERSDKPGGEFCDECKAKRARGECS